MENIYPITAAILANLLAQVLKPYFLYRKTKRFDIHQTIASGGFPSSHSSTVTALSTAIALQQGIESTYFAISLIFSIIVIYDAVNVRYYAGKNIQLTKQLVSDLEKINQTTFDNPIYHEKIKTVLGHKLIEVIGGIGLGLIVALLIYPIIH
ncbi:MAG: divergent PAP2 family protein [Erysipelotrichaceae bacterium]|nr:divergent PAP2 family protein [Erysipelotrichaceae bacterium]